MPKKGAFIDIAGQTFNDWTALYRDGVTVRFETMWRCRCKCGNESIISVSRLRKKAQSCNDCGQKRSAESRSLDVAGRRFGRLVAVEFAGKIYRGCRVWRCRCDCGIEVEAAASHLVQGVKISCGCAMYDSTIQRSEKIRRRMLALQNQRRARQLNADGSYTEEQVTELYFKQKRKCANCFCAITMDTLHRDHKTALSKGGTNHLENIQLLCRPCNVRKNVLGVLEFARRQGRLL